MDDMSDIMTFDELCGLYREEMNSSGLTSARKDLYRSMAELREGLRKDYERWSGFGPDSVMLEGAEHRKKAAERLCKEVVRIRTTKICNMAFKGALGEAAQMERLLDDEAEYYFRIRRLTRDQLNAWRHEA